MVELIIKEYMYLLFTGSKGEMNEILNMMEKDKENEEEEDCLEPKKKRARVERDKENKPKRKLKQTNRKEKQKKQRGEKKIRGEIIVVGAMQTKDVEEAMDGEY